MRSKPHLYVHHSRYFVGMGAVGIGFDLERDAWAYAALMWDAYLASLAFVEKGWPKSVH